MKKRRVPRWLLLGLVLAGALAVGSGVFDSSPLTASQRAVAIESGIKCPSCSDLSVANSSAQTAVIVRQAVNQLIAQGRSNRQIESFLSARYGSAIILEPPARGWSLLVWVLPLGGGLAAVVALATVLIRRRRAAFVSPSEAARLEEVAETGASMARLEDRRRFLEQSLADAFAEYQAGDLSEGDYQALRHRDTARLAIVDQLMDASANSERVSAPRPLAATLPDPVRTSPGPKRSRRQRILLSGGIAALTVALVLVVSLSASQRLPGQAVSGSILLSRQGQIQRSLAQAATLENQGHTAEAVRLYETVLGRQPGNEVAMAQLGWIEYETGVRGGSTSLIAKGRATLVEAVHLAPGDYAARLYLGTVLYQQDGNAAGAVTQYKKFLADHPPATVVTQAASILRSAYAKAGVPLPAQVP